MSEEVRDELLAATKVAELLAEAVPDRSRAGWGQWLANNRNEARPASYRLPFERLAGKVYYRRAEVDRYVDFERQRHLGTIKLTGRAAELAHALGLRTPGMEGTGRPFRLAFVSHQVDAEGHEFAQLVLKEPLMVYRLSGLQVAELYQALGDVMGEFRVHDEIDD